MFSCSQAGKCREAKQDQEEISRNHINKLYESSLSGVNPSELLRLCPAAEAEAQQERGSKPETQGNFFGVCTLTIFLGSVDV